MAGSNRTETSRLVFFIFLLISFLCFRHSLICLGFRGKEYLFPKYPGLYNISLSRKQFVDLSIFPFIVFGSIYINDNDPFLRLWCSIGLLITGSLL